MYCLKAANTINWKKNILNSWNTFLTWIKFAFANTCNLLCCANSSAKFNWIYIKQRLNWHNYFTSRYLVWIQSIHLLFTSRHLVWIQSIHLLFTSRHLVWIQSIHLLFTSRHLVWIHSIHLLFTSIYLVWIQSIHFQFTLRHLVWIHIWKFRIFFKNFKLQGF